MDVTGRNNGPSKETTGAKGTFSRTSHLGEAASDLLKDSKKVATELYEEGRHRVAGVQASIHTYSDEIIKQVHDRPIVTLFIAAGIGFILASFLRR